MTRIRRTIMALLTVASLALGFAGAGIIGASANDAGGVKYEYVLGTAPLCDLAPDACPDVARASNGDRLEFSGRGAFVTGSDDITGGGTFVHKNSAGTVVARGTWSAEELLSFKSFGTDPTLPPNLEGGLARVAIELRPAGSDKTLEAILTIDCAINSPLKPPREGVKVAVEGGLNFNTEVSGLTVFINQGRAED